MMTQPLQQNAPSIIELVVQELQNRIGQITTQLETEKAMLKAQATQEIQARDQRIEELSRALANASSVSTKTGN
jgi:predicted RNase H-like nuclease (RuvC/YqgF family)